MSLRTEDLVVSVAGRPLVGPVSLAVAAGVPLTILGETGAGKSLLAQAIMGALPPALSTRGAIWLGERRLDTASRRAREALWGRTMVMLPQEPWRALDPLMRAGSQVDESHALVAGQPWGRARAAAAERLGALGLDRAAAARLPQALSGGMAQRVAFAAATAGGARVLLVDEPTKGLDEARRDDVVALLARFVAEGGLLLTITHDVQVATALGGQVMILREGAVVEAGPAASVLAAPHSDYGRALVEADPARWPMAEPVAAAGARDDGAAPVLEAVDLAVQRGGRVLLERLSLRLAAGGRLAITGPSGLGKTSLLDTLIGLEPPAAGQVLRHGRAREAVGVQKLYQDPPAAFPARVPLAASLGDVMRRHRVAPARLRDLLERLAVSPALLERTPAAVSGGELQRLALARALVVAPAVILADEPTSRLDPVTQRRVMGVLGEVAAEAGAAVILVTHSATMASRWAGRTLTLEAHRPAA